MTCQCFLRPIRRDLPSSSCNTLVKPSAVFSGSELPKQLSDRAAVCLFFCQKVKSSKSLLLMLADIFQIWSMLDAYEE